LSSATAARLAAAAKRDRAVPSAPRLFCCNDYRDRSSKKTNLTVSLQLAGFAAEGRDSRTKMLRRNMMLRVLFKKTVLLAFFNAGVFNRRKSSQHAKACAFFR
jgi:hypothetical protein